MEHEEALTYLNKKIRLVLSNKYRFSGEVLEITKSTIIINDKLNQKVSIGLKDIVTCEVLDGY
jgi:hypothetical protein